jgi:hypothetical protein
MCTSCELGDTATSVGPSISSGCSVRSERGDRHTSPVGVESVSREGCIDELVDLGHVEEGLWAVNLGMSMSRGTDTVKPRRGAAKLSHPKSGSLAYQIYESSSLRMYDDNNAA